MAHLTDLYDSLLINKNIIFQAMHTGHLLCAWHQGTNQGLQPFSSSWEENAGRWAWKDPQHITLQSKGTVSQGKKVTMA